MSNAVIYDNLCDIAPEEGDEYHSVWVDQTPKNGSKQNNTTFFFRTGYVLSRATSHRAPMYGGMRTWVEGSPARGTHRTTVLFLDQALGTVPHGKVPATWSTWQPTGWPAGPHTNTELLLQLSPIHSHDSTAPDLSLIPIHKRYSGPRQYF